MNFLRRAAGAASDAVAGAWNFFNKNDSENIHIPIVAQLEDTVGQYVDNKVELNELQNDEMPDVDRDRKIQYLEELDENIKTRIKQGIRQKTVDKIIEEADKIVETKQLSLQLPKEIVETSEEIAGLKREIDGKKTEAKSSGMEVSVEVEELTLEKKTEELIKKKTKMNNSSNVLNT